MLFSQYPVDLKKAVLDLCKAKINQYAASKISTIMKSLTDEFPSVYEQTDVHELNSHVAANAVELAMERLEGVCGRYNVSLDDALLVCENLFQLYMRLNTKSNEP